LRNVNTGAFEVYDIVVGDTKLKWRSFKLLPVSHPEEEGQSTKLANPAAKARRSISHAAASSGEEQ
jgi:hypothetical protein